MTYLEQIVKSMEYLAKDKRTIFIGQSVSYSGNSIYNTLRTIPNSKKIETPVFEDAQMGLSTGLAIEGFIPITCYPRFDFLILAFNQLINHLDKIKQMSKGQIKLKVIIRVAVGSKKPLNAGPQHTQNYSKFLKKILNEIELIELKRAKEIFPIYKKICKEKINKSYILVEYSDLYETK
jgi:pyruvate/2-oxoglutarate/acetoin dehydrogenase E1 component